jgi:hypothetical protein
MIAAQDLQNLNVAGGGNEVTWHYHSGLEQVQPLLQPTCRSENDTTEVCKGMYRVVEGLLVGQCWIPTDPSPLLRIEITRDINLF